MYRLQHRLSKCCTAAISLVLVTSTISADIARTESGKPILSGTFDGATLTPLVRPKEFGDELYLTPAKAKALSEAEQRLKEATLANSDPNRGAPPVGGDGSPGAAGNVGGYNTFWMDRGEGALLVDGKFRTSIIVEPRNGQLPKLTPEAMAQAAKFSALKNDGTAWWLDQEGPGPYDNMEQRNTAERCLLSFSGAVPSIPSLYNNFKRLVQTDEHIMIQIEMIHDARMVRLNSEHPPAHVKFWLGDSIGWWEDDTLVIDTTNFTDKAAGFFGGGSTTHVVERLTPQADGNILYRFTVQDDTRWIEPWTGEYLWQRSTDKVFEYACHEGNYALGNIMRGARLLEQDALAAGDG